MSNNPTSTLNGNGKPSTPNPEVVAKPVRRRFTAEYKQRILQEAEACTQSGERGALLRREGLYSSHLNTWRRQRDRGALQGLKPAKRGRQADPQAAEIARLKRENERLKAKLERAELITPHLRWVQASTSKKKFRRCWASVCPRATRANDPNC